MAEVKECTYYEALLRQLHFILGIWCLLEVFTDLYCPFNVYLFIVDLTFGKILNMGPEES